MRIAGPPGEPNTIERSYRPALPRPMPTFDSPFILSYMLLLGVGLGMLWSFFQRMRKK